MYSKTDISMIHIMFDFLTGFNRAIVIGAIQYSNDKIVIVNYPFIM